MTITHISRTSEQLAGLSYETLKELIETNLSRYAPDGLWDRLTGWPVLPNTLAVLEGMDANIARDVQQRERTAAQLAEAASTGVPGARDDYEEFRAETAAWQAKAGKFQALVRRRLTQARYAAAQVSPAAMYLGAAGERYAENMRTLAVIVRAVIAHNASEGGDPADDALYGALERARVVTPRGDVPVLSWAETTMAEQAAA